MPRLRPCRYPLSLSIARARSVLFVGVCLLLLSFLVPVTPVHAQPRFILPTPPGETWRIIQGYGCGTHNAWDHYSLDLVNTNGRTSGAPVRAAADGVVFVWVGGSGTLILNHGGGIYTMYTHMASVVTTRRGQFIPQGAVIGTVGDRGSPGVPHLHFTAFSANGPWASGRKSLPLSFAEGYVLPEIGGCNQHGGTTLVAGSAVSSAPPSVSFSGGAELGRWYNSDVRFEFAVVGTGFSQAWNQDPSGDAPMYPQANAGYAQLAWAGEGLHTFHVRVWGADGQQTVATYGPLGYDVTPPELPAAMPTATVQAGAATSLAWSEASDNGSGVAGYRVYVGADAQGTSNWFTEEAQIDLPPLTAGRYLLRVQVLDYAGNSSAWVTLGEILSTGR